MDWMDNDYPPHKTGHYLVCQESTDHRKYRFVRYWNGKEWHNVNEEKYGRVTYWMILPEFP